MTSNWMPRLRLPLTREQFQQLPRNPAYKYDYLEQSAWLNPRPRFYHAVLDLTQALDSSAANGAEQVMLRQVKNGDWKLLAPVFAAAFAGQQPFASLAEEDRLLAARKSLEYTRAGGDGPWIDQASWLVCSHTPEQPLGAALVTLLPDTNLSDWDSYHWAESPPPDCITRRLGRPHLTWIFVAPDEMARGIGTMLLHRVAGSLLRLGYSELASTFLLGNESSMLWHWRNGFRLLSYPGSLRRLGQSPQP